MTLKRPRIMPTGPIKWEDLELCRCMKFHGPVGGLCDCGGAIPTEAEYKALQAEKDRLERRPA